MPEARLPAYDEFEVCLEDIELVRESEVEEALDELR